MKPRFLLAALLAFSSSIAAAADYTGKVDMLESWNNGNVAFSLMSSVSTCNAQFILNVSAAGSKNQYAVLLAAKSKDVQVKVVVGSCVTADGGGANYNSVIYLYLLDS